MAENNLTDNGLITTDPSRRSLVTLIRPLTAARARTVSTLRRWRDKVVGLFRMAPYYVFVDGLSKPIPLSPEGAVMIQGIMQMESSQRPKTLSMTWGDGDEIRFYVDRIVAVASTDARLWFGPNPFTQSGS
jgi:hypothetical protein